MSRADGPRARGWPLGPAATALLVVACAATGAAVAVVLRPSSSPRRVSATSPAAFAPPSGALQGDAVWAPGRRTAPPIALRDQSNRPVSLSGQRGHAVLLTFMDSHCKLICTLQGPSIRNVLRRVGPGRTVTLLVVSVNPWEDTAASSRAAGARYGFAGDWHWLRGSPAQLEPIWRSYGIEARRTAGDVSHNTATYLIDARGDERAGFNYPFPPAQVVRDLRRLAPPRAF